MISRIPSRRRSRRPLAAAAGTLAVLTSLASPPGLAQADVPSATLKANPVAAAGSGQHTVTLLTGDVVHVTGPAGGKQTADVTRPPGVLGGVRTETVGGDLYVYPDEVLPYLAANRLDRRLFDVTALIEQGYDDAHSDGIPLILGYGSSTAPSTQVTPGGATRLRNLSAIHATSVRAAKKQTRKLWRSVAPAASAGATAQAPNGAASAAPRLGDGLSKIWLDGRVEATLKDSTTQIGAPDAWGKGLDGKGVKVAVLDTGVDTHHPDVADRVGESQSFVPDETVEDGHGHGTHTASTVGGSGAASDGAEKGVAPGADLMIGKVLSDEGYGQDSWIIAGMEWAAGHGARVISMSLGSSEPSDGTDPMSRAVDRLTDETGALFVIAAGNSGGEGTLGSPGAADEALTVAAVDSADKRAYFSSQGPRYGDYALKPDISAPGVDILAAKAGGSAATGWYRTMSGTSMATPHVAGAAAILAQEHPDWKARELKDALMSTSKELPSYTAYQVGSGRADLSAATAATVTATGSAYFGMDAWPHGGERPVDRTVTYRNTGDEPVELNLALTASVGGGPIEVDPTADKGKPAPEGMFALSADTVTVPAHGSADVTAIARPDLGADGRRYLGQITATDSTGTPLARTRVGLYREDDRHNLHLTLKDRSGKPAAGYVEFQRLGDELGPWVQYVDDSGVLDLRLRTGTYSVLTYLDVSGAHGPDSAGMALMGDPEIVLDQDRDVAFDARLTREVRAEVPRRTEDRTLSMNWYRAASADDYGKVDEQYLLSAKYDTMYVLPTREVTRGDFEYETRWRKAYPLLSLSDDGRPVELEGQGGSSLYDGNKRLDVVYAGTGTPAEYAGLRVKGKIALITRSDGLTGSQRARAAADAGAALLIVVNDGPGKLFEYVGTGDGGYSAVPVATVTARTGAPLIADARSGRLRLHAEGVPDSPYVYDLSAPHPGRIPSTGLTYRPRPSDLATVDMRFHGGAGTPSGEYRTGWRPYRQYGSGFLQRLDIPGTRTDYLSAQPGTAWSEGVNTGPQLVLSSQEVRTAYEPGSWQVRDWFGPVTRPANGGTYWWSRRDKGSLAFNVQPWSDGVAGHGGVMQTGDKLSLKVYQDGILRKTTTSQAANLYPVPTTPSVYTFDLTAERAADTYRLSTRTHSVWQVRSDPVTDPTKIDRMAVLQMDFGIDTDLAGDARGGRQTLRLTPRHLDGAEGAGKIQGATLSVSFDDGATWKPVTATGKSGTWSACYDAPHHGYVSLRAEGWDDVGNRISQEVIRAYGLK
ncbi:S8 family serine peptidase [Streptomyces sp. NPDC005236]|uniref:S8 family serine peptidase n=1 Tax=Streptomyces sp. NPDC005236 TaxID=3157028 RepID=UPI0033AE38AC